MITKGRIDWMPRKKVWRVIQYKGKSDIPIGDYATKEQAVARLRELAKLRNPVLANPTAIKVSLFIPSGKRPKLPTSEQLARWKHMPDPFAGVTEADRLEAWGRGRVI